MPKSRTRVRKTRPRPAPRPTGDLLAVEVCLDGCCPPRLHLPGRGPARLPRGAALVGHGQPIKHEAPPPGRDEASTTSTRSEGLGGCDSQCR